MEKMETNSKNIYYLFYGLLIKYGPICHIVKLPISMIRPFSLVNISHITLYPQLEIIWKVLRMGLYNCINKLSFKYNKN